MLLPLIRYTQEPRLSFRDHFSFLFYVFSKDYFNQSIPCFLLVGQKKYSNQEQHEKRKEEEKKQMKK